MTEPNKTEINAKKERKTGLDLLRVPFHSNQISKLPKPTRAQTDAVRRDYKAGIRCSICGGWHHPNVVHLDYVGHAAITDRLLDADPHWRWEPLATDQAGLPCFDTCGGLWIKLTVCDQTRLGYGHPDGKTGGDAIKEAIGDALRNAAMRFGAALDLWHKGDLHADDADPDSQDNRGENGQAPKPEPQVSQEEAEILSDMAKRASTDRAAVFKKLEIAGESWADLPADLFVRVRNGIQAKLDQMEMDKGEPK